MNYHLNGYKAKSKTFKEMQKTDPNLDGFQKNYKGIMNPGAAAKHWDEITARQERARDRRDLTY
jgi:hypothetical protein